MSYRHLTTEERYTIELLKSRGEPISSVAEALERNESSIRRELARYGKRKKYNSKKASKAAKKRRARSSNGRKVSNEIKKYVIAGLKKLWSPEQIVGTLRLRKTRTPAQLVSVQWIYNFIRKDKQSGGKLYTHLRCTKKRRKKYGTAYKKRGAIPDRVDISERPAIVEKRSRFGDWEGDTIIGAGHHQAIISLVERKTRYTILIKVTTKRARSTANAIVTRFRKYAAYSHSITFDNGLEFACHKIMQKKLGIRVFFARPYASYERGLNENTNGLVRQAFPKKKSFATITKRALVKFEKLLNARPRKCIKFCTPQELLNQTINRKRLRALQN